MWRQPVHSILGQGFSTILWVEWGTMLDTLPRIYGFMGAKKMLGY